jgi:hypothetical protein
MSWIVVGSAALSVGGALYKGFTGGTTQAEFNEQKAAAAEMYQEKLGLLGEERGLALGAAQSQYAGGRRDVSMGTQAGMRDVQAGGDIAMAQSGLATSGTIEGKVQTQTKDLLGKYKSDMTKLVETRDLSKAEADLSYRSGEMSAEDAYQNLLTDIDSQPARGLEAMFS